jgi:hypothetical protein
MSHMPSTARRITTDDRQPDPNAQIKAIAGMISKLPVRQAQTLAKMLSEEFRPNVESGLVLEAMLNVSDKILALPGNYVPEEGIKPGFRK